MGYSQLSQRLGHQRWYARTGRALTPVERFIQRKTGARWSFFGHGIPELLLTTTGHASGLPRQVGLIYVEDGDNLVVASNYGRPHHPAWSDNLLATPRAVVTRHGCDMEVEASLLAGPERDRVWQLCTSVWPAFDTYTERSGRHLRVFALHP